MKHIAIINGPNLNLLSKREIDIYGTKSLSDWQIDLTDKFANKLNLSFFQSNWEGAILDYLHSLSDVDGIVINPGGLTHTSVSLRDALLSVAIPCIEVHISNIYSREDFRRVSLISDVCLGVISGLGLRGYELALQAFGAQLNQ